MKLLETAGLSSIVFHGTYIDNAISILSTNSFNLSSFIIDSPEVPSDYLFYMSTARSKNSRFILQLSRPVVFTLDGRKLGSRYKAKPFSYFKSAITNKHEWHESEDRIFSNKNSIPSASSYIKKIEIVYDVSKANIYTGNYEAKLNKLLLFAKKRNVPVIVYANDKDLFTSRKGTPLKLKRGSGLSKSVKKKDYYTKNIFALYEFIRFLDMYKNKRRKGDSIYKDVRKLKTNANSYGDLKASVLYDALTGFGYSPNGYEYI